MTKIDVHTKKGQENIFLESIISQVERIGKQRGWSYPEKNDRIETTGDRYDWVAIAQYIMTNAAEDSRILRKAGGHNTKEVIEFIKSFDGIVSDDLYEKGTKKTPTSKKMTGRKSLYQILLGISNSVQKKQKKSLNKDDLEMLFGILDPKSAHRSKNPLFLHSGVVVHTTKDKVGATLST